MCRIISNAKSKADLLAGPFADFVRTHKSWANAVLKLDVLNQQPVQRRVPKKDRVCLGSLGSAVFGAKK